MSKKVKIGVITDIHYGDKISISARQGQIGDILLLRTVHRLNRMIKPDITLILGDILDDMSWFDAKLFNSDGCSVSLSTTVYHHLRDIIMIDL